jgi:hypothetical protein
MTDTATAPEKTITIRESFLDKQIADLSKREYERGFKAGQNAARSIAMDIHSDTSAAIVVLQSDSRAGLSRLVKDRNSRRSGDNPGQAYLWTCELLRAYRTTNGGWEGVCMSRTYYDI